MIDLKIFYLSSGVLNSCAIALIKIFHSIGLEQEDNALGDIQPTQITNEKKDLLSQLTKDIGVAELSNGSYVDILKPWLSHVHPHGERVILINRIDVALRVNITC